MLKSIWSLDLNFGPKDYESSALTTELMARNVFIIYQKITKNTILFNGNRLGKVSWFVWVEATLNGAVVGEELGWNYCQKRCEGV